ncbi:mRNA-decapping enzyme subunit 2 [Clydaea vesicula]|uniref:mRNA-decapping enzyme subunit 2 n=1 Tax=Clydaea vesicula TaxID=447962 RepID=A0AAD5U7E0_9FUNG|nr:mRNA-decapping enzyme subunit 2 [Clydaea vesicula]
MFSGLSLGQVLDDLQRLVNYTLMSKIKFQKSIYYKHPRRRISQCRKNLFSNRASSLVCGAVILNEKRDKVLLVRGFKAGANWSFPRGKINKDERKLDCAIREVLEETGFDITDYVNEKNKVERTIREQQICLYIASGVPENTFFETQTRKEIGGIHWFKLNSLPGGKNRHENEENYSHNKFYMVTVFVSAIYSWISKHSQHEKNKKKKTPKNKNQNFNNLKVIDHSDLEHGGNGSDSGFKSDFDYKENTNIEKIINSQDFVDQTAKATQALKDMLGITSNNSGNISTSATFTDDRNMLKHHYGNLNTTSQIHDHSRQLPNRNNLISNSPPPFPPSSFLSEINGNFNSSIQTEDFREVTNFGKKPLPHNKKEMLLNILISGSDRVNGIVNNETNSVYSNNADYCNNGAVQNFHKKVYNSTGNNDYDAKPAEELKALLGIASNPNGSYTNENRYDKVKAQKVDSRIKNTAAVKTEQNEKIEKKILLKKNYNHQKRDKNNTLLNFKFDVEKIMKSFEV